VNFQSLYTALKTAATLEQYLVIFYRSDEGPETYTFQFEPAFWPFPLEG
jgi:hypothetical protein